MTLCGLRWPEVNGNWRVTGNDVTWPQVTGSDPKVTSFDRKSPGSGCTRPKTCIYCVFHFLQGCRLQEEAVTWQEMTTHHLRWLENSEGTVFDRNPPGSGCRRPKARLYCAFHSLQCCSSQEVVMWQEMTSRDLRWPEVTQIWCHWPELTWKCL